jgi:hypothetical protein
LACPEEEKEEVDLFDEKTLEDESRVRVEKKKKLRQEREEEEQLALSDDDDQHSYTSSTTRVRQIRKADPNVLAINLGTLSDAANLFTGDVVFCTDCKAAFTAVSNIEHQTGGDIWICEYCGNKNPVVLDSEEIPKGDTIDYIVENQQTTSQLNDAIIFCIDISGSMCCTSELKGEIKIKQDSKLTQSLDQFIERAHGNTALQYLPNEARNVSYVSRLQCVQAAVTSQIEQLAKEHPNKRVALVTFNNEVTVYLPGGVRHVVAGDKLDQFDYLNDLATTIGFNLNQPISESHTEFNNVVYSLEESGATALGPALLASISLAGTSPGSSVVLCTDGIANVGLGSLEFEVGDDPNSPALAFYQRVATTALAKGVAVSILTIKGSNTSLEFLAQVSTESRGYNDVVDPLNLTKNFNFVLQNAIIATSVTATMFLNKGLTFRHEKNAQNTKATREVGNCTKESTITFQYYPVEKALFKDSQAILFQVQISYVKLDGTKCLRVISKKAEVTNNREEAEKHVNVNVVGLHAQAQAAVLATEGQYSKARMVQKTNMRMVRRGIAQGASDSQAAQYNLWNVEAVRLNKAIKSTKITEKKEGVDYDSAEDDGSGSEEDEGKVEKRQVRGMQRKQRRVKEDKTSNVIYQARNPQYSAYSTTQNPLHDEKD